MAEKTIIQKMRERSASFIADPEATQALQTALADKAIDAVLGGRESEAWRTYMIENAVNNDQLKRLMGSDDMINEDWGRQTLAYITGDPTCSIDSFAQSERHLKPEMIASLVGGISNEIDAGFPANAMSLEELQA